MQHVSFSNKTTDKTSSVKSCFSNGLTLVLNEADIFTKVIDVENVIQRIIQESTAAL